MTESNKILTVSYGTFSCTLEGFDDPFGTMRGIAEYFRDLAAEDRYFGAEPPTPDVEMLQNIAQRDVQRRVEARIGENGVALRPAEAVEDAELSEPAPAVDAGARIPDPEPQKEAPQPQVRKDVPETAPLAFDDEYLMADEPEDVFVVDTKAISDAGPAPESIAEKLRRIRAVVSRNLENPPTDTNPFSEAGAGEVSAFGAPHEKRERALSETIRSITADISDGDDIEALNPADPDPWGEPVSLYEDEDEDENETEADADENEPDISAAQTDEIADIADEDVPAPDGDAESIVAGVMAATAEAAKHDEIAEIAHDDPVSSEAEDDARVSVDGADDMSDEPDEDVLDLASDEIIQTEATVDDDIPQDDPAELDMAQAEDGPSSPAPEKAAQLEPLSDSNGNVGRLLKETDEKFAEDDGIRRRRVISQMRAAVAATKAERILSKPVSPDQVAKEEQSPYRRDLTKIMPGDLSDSAPTAPREDDHAEAAPQDAAKPDDAEPPRPQKPAPLVLVSSQRVDEAPVKVAIPTKPQKRVVSEAGTFAAFAEEMGAEELPDLLEAAAAFSAFVEGQPHFSRPDIMKRVARIDPALSLSREAGLRSFGMLLRQGKIRKLQRGQFTIAEDTRFNPAHRIAGE